MIMDSLYFKEFIDKNEIIVIDKNNLMILNLLNGKIKKNIKINTNFSNLEFISNEKSLLFKNSGKYNDIYELNLKKIKKDIYLNMRIDFMIIFIILKKI